MLKTALLVLILSLNSDPWMTYVDQFFDAAPGDETAAQSVWATGTLYYASPEEYRSYIEEMVENEVVKSSLAGNPDFKSFAYHLAFELQDEHLLLTYLLFEESESSRVETFDQFYASSSGRELTKFTEKAVSGIELDQEDLISSGIGFEHFLASFHVSRNNISSDSFFKEIKSYWKNSGNNTKDNSSLDPYVLSTLLKAFYETGDYHQLNEFYGQIQTLHFLPHSRVKLNLLWGLDFALHRLGEVSKSLEIQRKFTVPISEYIQSERSRNTILTTQGAYLYQLGKYRQAEEVFTSLLQNSDEFDLATETKFYHNLSLIYFKTGESAKYVETQLKALEIAKELNNYNYQSRIYRNLHIFYRKNKNWDLAEQYIDEAAKVATAFDNNDDLILIHISKAVFADQYLNNRKEAYQQLEMAESFVTENTEPRFQVRILSERSNMFKKDRRLEDAKQMQKEIMSISARHSNTSTYLEALIKLTQISNEMGDYRESSQLVKEIRVHDSSGLDFKTLILSQTVQAKLAAHSGDIAEAERLFSGAADLVFERSRNTSESGYWSVESQYLYLFEKYADFLIDRGDDLQALALFDRVKTINDATLTDNPLVRSTSQSEETLTAIQNLTNRMDRVRKQLLLAGNDERLSLQNQLERLSAERRSLSASSDSRLNDEPVNIRAIQRLLRPAQYLLHMTEIGEHLYYTVVRRKEITIQKLYLREDDKTLYENAIESILVGRTDLNLLYQIGKDIGIDKLAETANSFIVMPDGYFHQLPLGIFPVERPSSPHGYGSARYLIEDAEVRTLNSLRDFTDRSSRTEHQYGFTGFGVEDFHNEATSRTLVSLPKAPGEIESISVQLNRVLNKQELINQNATVERFQKTAGNSRILHMATHSEVSDSDPLFSTLHFYADGSEEVANQTLSGRLFAYEVFELDLQNDLIMLNSCESGGDRFLQGSGIMGISRALRYAGARSLILNSWSVNDQYAAEFAEEFYKHINRGESKSKALQLAKVQFIRNKNANPHFWGPYILNGDNRPLLNKRNNHKAALLLTALFICGLIFTRRRLSGEFA